MFKRFIHRPVLAIVISVIIVFTGLLAIKQLPISQFPEIAPTTVNIFIAYPGASADVLINSTIIPLETAINGVQGMRYVASDATSAGEGTLRIIFEPGTDPDQAVVRVKTAQLTRVGSDGRGSNYPCTAQYVNVYKPLQ